MRIGGVSVCSGIVFACFAVEEFLCLMPVVGDCLRSVFGWTAPEIWFMLDVQEFLTSVTMLASGVMWLGHMF